MSKINPGDLTPELIRELREERLGWSMQTMADYLEVGKPTIWRWENKMVTPDKRSASILALLWNRLEEIEEARKQEFIETLAAAATAGGVFLLLQALFDKWNNEDEEA